MRFITLVRSAESNGPPPPPLMEAIAKLAEKAIQDGTLIETGGLLSISTGARVRLEAGSVTVTDGPFIEAKELIGGYAVHELPSKEAAVEAARELMELHKKHWQGWVGETEVRQVFVQ